MQIKIIGSTAVIADLYEEDGLLKDDNKFVVIKTMTHDRVPSSQDNLWFDVKPGIKGKVVGFAKQSGDIDEVICDDLLQNKNIIGDIHRCNLSYTEDGATYKLVYVPGYHRAKFDDVEYETYKVKIA